MRLPSPGRPRSKLDLLVWALPALGLAVVAGLWGVVLNNLATERESVERDIEQRVRALAQAFEEHTRRSLQQIDQITAFVAYDLEQRKPPVGGSAEAGTDEMIRLLRLGLADLPGVMALYIADERGQVRSATLPITGSNVSDREYFRVHRDGAERVLHVGKPKLGHTSQQWVVPLTRRLQRGDGVFAGFVAVLVDPRYFTDFYRSTQFGKQGLVSLQGLDWVVRARRSGEQVWFGDTSGNNTLIHQLAKWPEGSYVATSRLDGITRRLAYKTMHGYPLVAVAGLSLDEAMQPYQARRQDVLTMAGGASLALLLSFGGLSLAAASLRRSQAGRERARAQFEAASNASLDAFWIMRAERDAAGTVVDFRFTHCNDRGAELLRKPKSAILGRTRAEVFAVERDPRFFEMYCEVLRSRQPLLAEFVIATPPADGMVLQHQVVAVGDGVALTSRDVTLERRREQSMLEVQQALRDAEKRLRDIADNLPVLIAYIDPQERMSFLNATFKDWLGVVPSEALGQPLREVLGADLYGQRAPWLRRALSGERVGFELESRALGVTRVLRNDYVPDIGPTGAVQGIYALSQDISVLKAVEQELLALAQHDSLTGLANRHHFNDLLLRALARAARSRQALALLFLDIDKFKSINDSLGHALGDAVLKEFAQRLLLGVRTTDTVARLAGDEFVIILEAPRSEAEPQFVARKLAAIIGRPFEVEGCSLPVTTSIGIAYHAQGPVTPAELLARADQALYEAKRAGRNTYRLSQL